MPERPDLRLISGSIREALADYDRDALVDILTYVFKEYVVEGPPPLLVNQAERFTELEGLSFPELMSEFSCPVLGSKNGEPPVGPKNAWNT